MTQTDYNQHQHKNYHEGRHLRSETAKLWMDLVRETVGEREIENILDLGSGTGRFSSLLADTFNAEITGVEPADKMRAVAEKENNHPGVHYFKGSAESIPAEDSFFDLVWMSMMIHHVNNLTKASGEIHRVVKPGGLVCIRNSFGDRLDGIPFYDYFPGALEVDKTRLPAFQTVRDAFEKQGFRFMGLQTIEQITDVSLAEYFKRVQKRSYSTFEFISEEEIEQGLALMQDAASKETPPKPVIEPTDFMVFQQKQ